MRPFLKESNLSMREGQWHVWRWVASKQGVEGWKELALLSHHFLILVFRQSLTIPRARREPSCPLPTKPLSLSRELSQGASQQHTAHPAFCECLPWPCLVCSSGPRCFLYSSEPTIVPHRHGQQIPANELFHNNSLQQDARYMLPVTEDTKT